MNVVATPLPGVLVLEPRVFKDDRGAFLELWQAERYAAVGVAERFVQDNVSRSVKGTLRGLHFQEPRAQGKLVAVTRGAVFDVIADVRRGSPTFGRWWGTELTDENRRQLWIPAGYAHGFCVLSDWADFIYKCTELYAPELDRGVTWNDPDLAIAWPITEPLLSPKDARLPRLADAPMLPAYR